MGLHIILYTPLSLLFFIERVKCITSFDYKYSSALATYDFHPLLSLGADIRKLTLKLKGKTHCEWSTGYLQIFSSGILINNKLDMLGMKKIHYS